MVGDEQAMRGERVALGAHAGAANSRGGAEEDRWHRRSADQSRDEVGKQAGEQQDEQPGYAQRRAHQRSRSIATP